MKSPGVRFPPPLLFAGPWLLGAALTAWRRWPVTDGPIVSLHYFGAILVVCALGQLGWSLALFALHRTSLLPHRPASAFVETGPYRYTRNPIYLGFAGLHAGSALMLNSVWLLLGVPLGVYLMTRFVIRHEEQYMLHRFGQAYAEYCTHVRRWV